MSNRGPEPLDTKEGTRGMGRSLAVILTVCLSLPAAFAAPLERAHAHNDYHHERPLLDALAEGFCSVEADVFLVDGALLVAHNIEDVKPERSLQVLYLDPLLERVRANGGRVYAGGSSFTLLIDIKSDGPRTYTALKEVLADYAEILTEFTDSAMIGRAVTVILSGACPRAEIAQDSPRLVAVDGRMPDLDANPSPYLVPLISASWIDLFHWYRPAPAPVPEEIQAELRRLAERAHAQGRRVRLWAAPDRPAVWQALWEAGFDLINTDKLEELAAFLRERLSRGDGG